MTTDVPVFEAVRYGFKSHAWYARAVWPDGRTLHGEGLQSEWAAERWAHHMRGRFYRDMVKRGDIGNGEVCPLFPEHGRMHVLQSTARPPTNYCSHAIHDGWHEVPRSRALWPVHGFEDAVAAYNARLDRAIREAGLPDLSDIEVT